MIEYNLIKYLIIIINILDTILDTKIWNNIFGMNNIKETV